MSQPAIIRTERLDLIPMTPDFLAATLEGDYATAEQLIGLAIPQDWWGERTLAQIRLEQVRNNPAYLPWMPRAIGLRGAGMMAGHLGFHSQPDPPYLAGPLPGGSSATGGIEFGYTIFQEFRRLGYAREAIQGLMDWAHRQHRISRFVLSISPSNTPSLNLARQLGFRRIGSHYDEDDGPEDVFERRLPDLPQDLR